MKILDELNFIILLSNYMADLATKLDPVYSVPSMGGVAEVSGLLSLPKPTISTISNYLSKNSNNDKATNSILNNMKTVEVEV